MTLERRAPAPTCQGATCPLPAVARSPIKPSPSPPSHPPSLTASFRAPSALVLPAPHASGMPYCCRHHWRHHHRLSTTLCSRNGLHSRLQPPLLLLHLPRLKLPPLPLYVCLLHCFDPGPPLSLCMFPRQLCLTLLLCLACCLSSCCLLRFASLFGSVCLSWCLCVSIT